MALLSDVIFGMFLLLLVSFHRREILLMRLALVGLSDLHIINYSENPCLSTRISLLVSRVAPHLKDSHEVFGR